MRRLILLGWIAIWSLFVVFHVFFFTNDITSLLWLTLFSVGPIWLATAIGGTVEVLAIFRGKK